MESNMNDTITQIIGIIGAWGLNVLGALAILVAAFLAAGWAARMTAKALSRTQRVDETLRHFLANVVRYALIILTIIAVLERFGVETTSFIAVLGAAGLAFQGTLSHIAAGIMLLLFRPFRVGQFIDVAGVAGTVESISLFTTELNTQDNVYIVVPNGQLWGTAVKNYSHNATRRVDFAVGIGYSADIGKAFGVIREILAAASNYWPLKLDLIRRIKEAFDTGGISIPFPQRTIHMAKES
jgi:small conductance mechanosensitive channel